ncbi:MAG: hypothetical protein O2904_04270 [bacterium]|nr:hypothetical protein [bacterium]
MRYPRTTPVEESTSRHSKWFALQHSAQVISEGIRSVLSSKHELPQMHRKTKSHGLTMVSGLYDSVETMPELVMMSADALDVLPTGQEALETLRSYETNLSGHSYQGNDEYPIYVVAQDRFRFAAGHDGTIYSITYRDRGDRGPMTFHPIAKFPPVLENRDLIVETVSQSPGQANTPAQQAALDSLTPAFDPRDVSELFSDQYFLDALLFDDSPSTSEVQASASFDANTVVDQFAARDTELPDSPYFTLLSTDELNAEIEIHTSGDYSYVYSNWGEAMRIDHVGGTVDTVVTFPVDLRGHTTNLIGLSIGSDDQTYSMNIPLENGSLVPLEDVWDFSTQGYTSLDPIDGSSLGDALPAGYRYPAPALSIAEVNGGLEVMFASDRDYTVFDVQTSPIRTGQSVGRVLVEHVGGIVNGTINIPLHDLGPGSGSYPVFMIDPNTNEMLARTYMHLDHGTIRGALSTARNTPLPIVDVAALSSEQESQSEAEMIHTSLAMPTLNQSPAERMTVLRNAKIAAQYLMPHLDAMTGITLAERDHIQYAASVSLVGNVDTGMMLDTPITPSISILSMQGNTLVVHAQTPYDQSVIRLSSGGYFANQEFVHEGGSTNDIALLAIEGTKESKGYAIELLDRENGTVIDRVSVQWDNVSGTFSLHSIDDIWTPERQAATFAALYTENADSQRTLTALFASDAMAQVHSNPDLFTAVELQSLQSVDVAGTSLDSLQGRKLYDQLPEDSPLRILSNSPGDLARALHPELWPVEGDEPHLQSLVVDISDPGDAADQMAFHRNALLTNRSIVLSQTGSQLGALQHATEDILNAALQHAHRLFRGENEPAVRTDWNFVHATMTANNRYLREASIDLNTGVPSAEVFLNGAISLLRAESATLVHHQVTADPVTYEQRMEGIAHRAEMAQLGQRNALLIAQSRDHGGASERELTRITNRIQNSLIASTDPRAVAVVANATSIETLFADLDAMMASLAAPTLTATGDDLLVARELDTILHEELSPESLGDPVDVVFSFENEVDRIQLAQVDDDMWVLKMHRDTSTPGTLVQGQTTEIFSLVGSELFELYAYLQDDSLIASSTLVASGIVDSDIQGVTGLTGIHKIAYDMAGSTKDFVLPLLERALETHNERSTGSIDRWYATAGEEPIDVTWSLPITVPGEYFLQIHGQSWDFDSALLSTSSGDVQLSSVVGAVNSDVFTIDAPGNYALTLKGVGVPVDVGVDEITFSLVYNSNLNVGETPPVTSKFHSMFVVDHAEQFDETSVFMLEGGEVMTGVTSLINHFSPVLHFAEGEQFDTPYSVDSILQNSDGVSTGDANGELVVSQTLADTEGKIYGSVLQEGDKLAINYYFFFPMSNWAEHDGYNTHQGDWEGATVFLEKNDAGEWVPEEVGLAQHVKVGDGPTDESDGLDLVNWEDAINDSGKLRIYVGLGGHASYSDSGTTPWFLGWKDEIHISSDEGRSFDAVYLGRVNSNLSDSVDWIRSSAHWGSFDLDGIRFPFDGDSAPRGPVFEDNGFTTSRWFNPWEWVSNSK